MKALFPSLSAQRTSKIVREQVEKIDMKWENLDEDWIKLYVHLNRENCTDISEIEHLLPVRRNGGEELKMAWALWRPKREK